MHEADPEAQVQKPRDEPPPESSIWMGIAVTLLLHMIQILLVLVSGSPFVFFFIGVSQLVYMIPAFVWVAFKQKDRELAKGLAIGAGITFLLNATCFGIVFVMFGGTI